jgi:hypothetical protein
VLNRLCALVEANDKHLMGAAGENFAQVVRVLADSALLDSFTGEVVPRVQALLQKMAAEVDPAMMTAAFSALSAEQQSVLQRLSQQTAASPPAAPR